MVTAVIRAITPELVADTAAIHAASVAFLTNSIGCEGTAAVELAEVNPFLHILNMA